MEDGVVAENRVLAHPVEERREHPRPLRDGGRILLGLVLLDGVLGHGRLRGQGRDDEGRVELGQVETQRLELRVATSRLDRLRRKSPS